MINLSRHESLSGLLPGLQELLDTCYPKPPKDVFYRSIEQYRIGFPAYVAMNNTQKIVGFVFLSPNSKGGTLETLAVHPECRNLGIAKMLVSRLLEENFGVIQITTRIPLFFEKLGFKQIMSLPDGSHFMIYINF